MKSGALSIILSALALGGVGLVYMKVEDLNDRLSSVRTHARQSADAGGCSTDEFGDEGYEGAPAKPAPESSSEPNAAPGGKTAKHRKASARDEIEELKRQVGRLEKQVKENRSHSPMRLMNRKFARSAKHLSSLLKLNKTQEAQVENAVDNGKRRIDEILKIPDESGTSPYERRKEMRKKMEEAMKTGKWGEVTKTAMEHRNFREQKIPGRNTTYGDEIKRVQDETRGEIANTLTADQKKTFDDTNTDHMLGGGGGTQIAYTTSLGHGDGEGGTGVFVERGVDIAIEDKGTESSTEKGEADKDDGE